jgi:hypothetical protein
MPVEWPAQSADHQPSRQEVIAEIAAATASILLFSAFLIWVGFGLLAANRWTRWVAIVVYSSMAAWFLFELIQGLYHGPPDLNCGLRTTVVVIASSIVAYLLRRSTRDWFRLAAQVKAEHRRSSGIFGRRQGASS